MLFLVIALIILISSGGVGFFLWQSKKNMPLTAESIPPIPTETETTQHFTPMDAVNTAPKKPVNKTFIIAAAVAFNIILISGVIFVAKNMTQKQAPAPVAKTPPPPIHFQPTLVPIKILPTSSTRDPILDVTSLPKTGDDPANLPTTSITPPLATSISPTEIVVVATTESPATISPISQTVTSEPAPTIPSAGSPLPYLLIIVPALLVAVAFIL